uniref:Uncharacterized protein n=1 Tax=Lepeophtheirus salmonis TaxID=72036 RepID=A0A0K2T6I1_LEPSM
MSSNIDAYTKFHEAYPLGDMTAKILITILILKILSTLWGIYKNNQRSWTTINIRVCGELRVFENEAPTYQPYTNPIEQLH